MPQTICTCVCCLISKRRTLALHSASALFITWRIDSARFAKLLMPRDHPWGGWRQYDTRSRPRQVRMEMNFLVVSTLAHGHTTSLRLKRSIPEMLFSGFGSFPASTHRLSVDRLIPSALASSVPLMYL